jgi:hypothetical protein
VNCHYLRKITAGFVVLGLALAPLANAGNIPDNSTTPSHYKKGASCVQESSKAGMFTCWGMFGNELVGVDEIYKHGWRVVAFKPRTDDPNTIDNGILIIEEQ